MYVYQITVPTIGSGSCPSTCHLCKLIINYRKDKQKQSAVPIAASTPSLSSSELICARTISQSAWLWLTTCTTQQQYNAVRLLYTPGLYNHLYATVIYFKIPIPNEHF